MKYKLYCKICRTPVVVKKSYAYMQCMCDEDNRIFKLNIETFDSNNLYLFGTEGNEYVSMETKKI